MAKRRLSQQQSRRIEQGRRRRQQQGSQAGVHGGGLGPEAVGLVVAGYGHLLAVEDDQGRIHNCTARRQLPQPVAGDRVRWQVAAPGQGIIVHVEPRRSELARRDRRGRARALAANVELVIVVCASRPPLNEFLIDRYLVAVVAMGVEPLIVLNKVDLLSPSERSATLSRLEPFTAQGVAVVPASARTAHGMDQLLRHLRQRTAVMVGQSGVGKSSLVSALVPDREVAVSALSESTGLGTHTTTNACLYHLEGGACLIDSPGVRGFEPTISAGDLELAFPELSPALGRCRFADCNHTVEPGCALRQAVSEGRVDSRRFRSYLKLQEELRAGALTS